MTRATLDPTPPPAAKDCPVAPDSPLWTSAREVAFREVSRAGRDGNPCAVANEFIEALRTSSKPRIYGMDDSCQPRWSAFACLCWFYAQNSNAERDAIRARIKTGEWYWLGTVTPPTLPCSKDATSEQWCCPSRVEQDAAYFKNPPDTGEAKCAAVKVPWYKQPAIIAFGVVAISAGAIAGVAMSAKK